MALQLELWLFTVWYFTALNNAEKKYNFVYIFPWSASGNYIVSTTGKCLVLHVLSLGGINKYVPALLHFRANILLHEKLGIRNKSSRQKSFCFLFFSWHLTATAAQGWLQNESLLRNQTKEKEIWERKKMGLAFASCWFSIWNVNLSFIAFH